MATGAAGAAMTAALAIDPNPCHLYPWPEAAACPRCYSGAHVCGLGAGHAGPCVCGHCDQSADVCPELPGVCVVETATERAARAMALAARMPGPAGAASVALAAAWLESAMHADAARNPECSRAGHLERPVLQVSPRPLTVAPSDTCS